MSSDDSDEEPMTMTPPEIMQQAAATSDHLIPEKSKLKYECTYHKFMDWRIKNHAKSFSENVLMAYFGHIRPQFKPTSLWAMYSMLRTMIGIKHNVNIANYPKLKAYLKRQSDGYHCKKSKVFTASEVNKFIKEAPHMENLFKKVVLIIGISGACRKQELKDIKMSDIEDTRHSLVIHIPKTKTEKSRSFVISGNFYNICMEYINFRRNVTEPSITQLFLNFQNGKCTKQVVGVNKIGQIPRQVAEYLKLPTPSLYTGHALRRTSATILVDAGGDLMALKRHGGWSSSTVAESYVDESMATKTSTSNKILQSIENQEKRATIGVTELSGTENFQEMPSTSTAIFAPTTAVLEKCATTHGKRVFTGGQKDMTGWPAARQSPSGASKNPLSCSELGHTRADHRPAIRVTFVFVIATSSLAQSRRLPPNTRSIYVS
ncbi:uncharacterized protein LOC135137744 [Zophobas morio]|uniref:uncharacterized protein LOC135137744 n=1 Tax=Zophobas morio TaxID=2755281 RepID=UPI00308346EB